MRGYGRVLYKNSWRTMFVPICMDFTQHGIGTQLGCSTARLCKRHEYVVIMTFIPVLSSEYRDKTARLGDITHTLDSHLPSREYMQSSSCIFST